MTKPQDARSKRTAEALETAFLRLLEEKPLAQITIREITSVAEINYATFFRHHASKEALLDHLASAQINHLVEATLPILDTVNARAAIQAVITYVHENRLLWKALLTGGAANIMREEQLRLSRNSAATRTPRSDELPVELAINCTASLMFEMLAWWVNQSPEKYTISDATEILIKLIGDRGLFPASPE